MRFGFRPIEVVTVMGVFVVFIAVTLFAIELVQIKFRDATRKADLAQLGSVIGVGCFMPEAGAGTYDLADLAAELRKRIPEYAYLFARVPRDPKTGSSGITNYKYAVTREHLCSLYANLESEQERVTLQGLTAPTPGGGNGVLAASTSGWNGSTKYFQVTY